jgi:CRISPR-associated protein Cmr4
MAETFKTFRHLGMALDPIHVGTGGARLGRVDLTIVRDPVTRIPKIPGSSLAGVYRAYAAMAQQARNPNRQLKGQPKPYYPDCAGQGQPDKAGKGGHCGQADCPICTVFGFARGAGGGFAGLAAFSDAHVLLFPVATREGPVWVTCPMALGAAGVSVTDIGDDAIYRGQDGGRPLNLGWLLLPVRRLSDWQRLQSVLTSLGVLPQICQRLGVVPDKLFAHVVNSSLEVRTSVAVDPATGAAQEGALFSYEALPRATVLYWEVTCKNPAHFRVGSSQVVFKGEGEQVAIDDVHNVIKGAHTYLEHLGIGGMGTRGMGRLRVLCAQARASATSGEVKDSAEPGS